MRIYSLVTCCVYGLLLTLTGCNCDGGLSQIPEPSASLEYGSDSTPPLERLEINLGASLIDTQRTVELAIRNSGDGALTVTDIRLTSDESLCPQNASAFSILSPAAGADGFRGLNIAAEEDSLVTIGLTPEDGTPLCAMLEVHSDDSQNPILFALLKGQGDAPQLCAQNGLIDFGEVYIGDTQTDVIVLESCGTRPVEISNFTPNGYFPPFGYEPPALPLTLDPTELIEVPVSFAPTEETAYTITLGTAGLLEVQTNVSGQFYQIALEGTAKKTPSCELLVAPSVLNFGQVAEGRDSRQTVILRNLGESDCSIEAADIRDPPLSFSRTLLDFSIGDTLTPGDVANIEVVFAPLSVQGSENGFLDISSNDPASPLIEIPLQGTSIEITPCLLEASPTGLNFGNQAIGSTSEREVILTNVGTDTCSVQGIAVTTGTDSFSAIASILPLLGSPVPAGSSLSTIVTYHPESESSHSGNLQIQYKELGFGNPTSQLNVPLDGAGLPATICVEPQEVNFGDIGIGDVVDEQITVSNCGATTLDLRGAFLEATSHPDFSLQNIPSLPQDMAPGASTSLTVRAAPTAAGAAIAGTAMFGTVSILSNDPDQPSYPVPVRANAEACSSGLICQPLELNFGVVDIGQTLARSFSCFNAGLTGLSPSPTIDEPFQIVNSPNIIPSQATGVFTVLYTPDSVATHQDVIDLGADNCTGQQIEIQVLGEGSEENIPDCPTPQTFTPEIVWEWNGGSTLTNSSQVWVTPLISRLEDTNSDGHLTREDTPRVIFVSFDPADAPSISDIDSVNDPVPGVLRAVDGITAAEVFSVTESEYRLNSSVNIALADIDADGFVEIIGQQYILLEGVEAISGGPKLNGKFARGHLIAFEHDGTFKWISEEWTRSSDEVEDAGGIAIGDVDGDGFGEIALGDHLFDHNGNLLWRGDSGSGSTGHGPVSVLADVDNQPGLELVAGRTVYRNDGSILWSRDDLSGLIDFDGHPAIADLDNDGSNEIMIRSSELYVLDGATGNTLAGPLLPPTDISQGAECDEQSDTDCTPIPTNAAIMDIDGDGDLEIAISNENVLLLYDHLLNEIWRSPITDQTGASGPVGFDFEADGHVNLVYADEVTLWVYDALGESIYSADRSSITMMETASIGDINLDGHANLAIGNNSAFGGVANGLTVLANTGTSWAHARAMWNQHAYIESMVGELGTLIYWPDGMDALSGFRTASAACR
jgi:hypothetical protein